jgi:hypothetical protein
LHINEAAIKAALAVMHPYLGTDTDMTKFRLSALQFAEIRHGTFGCCIVSQHNFQRFGDFGHQPVIPRRA